MDFTMEGIRLLLGAFDPEEPTGDPFLDARYEAQVAKFGMPTPYWRFFFWLCKTLRPRTAVELGAWQGTCACHMASGGARKVVTIDHHSDPGDDENERLCLEAAAQYPNLVYLKSWTWDAVERVKEEVGRIDLLFIDSWHHYDKAMRDWDAYRPLLADPALVVADDLCDVEPTLHQMERFWKEISEGRNGFVTSAIHAGYPMGFVRWEAGWR